MEILNKTSKEIFDRKFNRSKPHVSFMNMEKIYFPIAATTAFSINPGLHMHFLMEPDRLYFYINQDPAGFSIVKALDGPNGLSVRVRSQAAIAALIKRYPDIKTGKKFPLRHCNTRVNGCNLVEIMIHTKI